MPESDPESEWKSGLVPFLELFFLLPLQMVESERLILLLAINFAFIDIMFAKKR